MQTHDHRPGDPNVVAVFEEQGGAQDAVVGLRAAGFGDNRIRYLARMPSGRVIDLVAKGYLAEGLVLGLLIGGALGLGIGWYFATRGAQFGPSPDPWGITTMCGICGALFGLFGGGAIGWSFSRRELPAGLDVPRGVYVVAVDAGDAQDRAWAVLRRYGGHEIAAHPGGGVPVMHPV